MLQLDAKALTDPLAKDMRDTDLSFLQKAVLRLFWLLLQVHHYMVASAVLGMRLLMGLLCVLPDSRLVEEIHQYLRDLGRLNRSNVSSKPSLFAACVRSHKLEGRGLTHNLVTQEEFIDKFRSCRYSMAPSFAAKSLVLPAELSRMLGQKDWQSPSAANFANTVMTWYWVKLAFAQGLALDAAWWTKMVWRKKVYGHKIVYEYGPSLGCSLSSSFL